MCSTPSPRRWQRLLRRRTILYLFIFSHVEPSTTNSGNKRSLTLRVPSLHSAMCSTSSPRRWQRLSRRRTALYLLLFLEFTLSLPHPISGNNRSLTLGVSSLNGAMRSTSSPSRCQRLSLGGLFSIQSILFYSRAVTLRFPREWK